jgi:hypothetical protein
LIGLAKTGTWTNKQIGLAGLVGLARLARLHRLAQTAARIDGQIRLAELTKLAARRRKKEVPIVLLTQKAGLRRIRLTRKAGLQNIRLTWQIGLYTTRGTRNRKKERVMLQAKGQLYGGAQGVLPRHKNEDCKRCVKESWSRKKEEVQDY